MRLIRLSAALATFAVLAVGTHGAPTAYAQTSNAKCTDCGVIQSMRYVEEKGQGTGVGAVTGGVLGGVVGHQFGSGRGNTAATIVGAGAGAYAGHQVEKEVKKKKYWSVSVRMDDGSVRNLTYSERPPAKEGERVKLLDGGRRMALIAN